MKKLMFEKYESVISKQLKHPMLKEVKDMYEDVGEDDDDDEDDFPYREKEQGGEHHKFLIQIPNSIDNELGIISNFDAWLFHTNFDITPLIKNKLDKVEGIELLKICTRYRFLIGVGRMFEFTDVRQSIEKEILS